MTVQVIDEGKAERYRFFLDIIALLVLVAAVGAMLLEAYFLGFTSFSASALSLSSVQERDASFLRLVRDAFLAGLATAWIAFRLFKRSSKERVERAQD